jgi:hypothetical protein
VGGGEVLARQGLIFLGRSLQNAAIALTVMPAKAGIR